MESYGWRGQGSSNQPETGIAQALDYYARYGGELLGARRSDNPLTLTHVRWHDQSGHVYDATHSPETSGDIDSAEREVWVQLALDLPVAAAGSVSTGGNSTSMQGITVTSGSDTGRAEFGLPQSRPGPIAPCDPGGGASFSERGMNPEPPGMPAPGKGAPRHEEGGCCG